MTKRQRNKPQKRKRLLHPDLPTTPALPVPQANPAPMPIGCWERIKRVLRLLLVILSLLGLVTLVELYPRLSASQQPPFYAEDQIPDVTVSNEGYLQVTDVRIGCFILNMKISENTFQDELMWHGSPPQKVLTATESYTVSCWSNGPAVVAPIPSISNIDLVVVTYYRPWPLTFLRFRKFFRFVGRNNGTRLYWVRQPSNGVDKEFDDSIRRFEQRGVRFP